MRVLIASSSPLAIPLYELFDKSTDHEVLGVLTNPDKPTGRGQRIEANELAHWAEAKDLSVYKPNNSAEIESLLARMKPEIVITIAYGQLIKKTALSMPKHGWINIHFSILPKWRGAAPVQHAIIAGETTTGVSIFKLDTGMDTGPVYSMKSFDIKNHETTEDILKRLSVVGAQMSLEVLAMIEAGNQPIPQELSEASSAPKLSKNDGKINWGATTLQINNHFRALQGNPGVWSNLETDRIKIDALRVTYLSGQLSPGEVLIENEKLIVGARDGAIELLQITPAGRNSMSAAEFVRGLTIRSGLRFG